jgi:hypothetical protein
MSASSTARSRSPSSWCDHDRMRKWLPIVLGVLLILIGGVWTGQGLGYITGSFMTGERLWTSIGLICVVGGLLLVVLGVRRRTPRS